MDFSQVCFSVRTTVFRISIKPKLLCPEDMFHADHTFTTPAEERFIAFLARRRTSISMPQFVADQSVVSEIPCTVGRRLHNAVLYDAKRPIVCVPVTGRQRRACLSWAREHGSWNCQIWASVHFTDESRLTLEKDSGRLLIWRE